MVTGRHTAQVTAGLARCVCGWGGGRRYDCGEWRDIVIFLRMFFPFFLGGGGGNL